MWSNPLEFLRQRFTRVTSSVAYIPQIDGLRAMAMLLVLIHHVTAIYLEDTHRFGTQELPRDWSLIVSRSPSMMWVLNLGIGVPIFCAISGFVLTIPFARSYLRGTRPPSWWLYLLRRLIRMEPPYILNMTFMLLMVLMPWRMGWGYAIGMAHLYGPHYLASLAYLHAQIYQQPSWVNGVAWTLEIEVQFYLLLPLVAELFRVRRKLLRRLIFATMVLSSALFSQLVLPGMHSARLDFSLLLQLQFFLSGVLLADIYLDPPRSWRPGPILGDVLAMLCTVLLVVVLHWCPKLTWTEPFLVASLFYAVFHGRFTTWLFSTPIVTVPGTMCYTIYLYHYFIAMRLLPFTIRLFPPVHALWWDVTLQMLILLVPVLLISAVLFALAEQPFVVLSHAVATRFRSTARPKTSNELSPTPGLP